MGPDSDGRRLAVVWLLFGWVSYIALFYTVPFPYFTVPVFLGLGLGASLPSGRAGTIAGVAWLLGSLGAPTQKLLWKAVYNEAALVDAMNRDMPVWWLGLAAGTILAPLVAEAVSRAQHWSGAARRSLSGVLLSALLLNFFNTVIMVNPFVFDLFRQEPANKSYHFDGQQQLKAFHLYKAGTDYYHAFRLAIEADQRPHSKDAQSLRPPYLYWMLGLLPGASWIPLQTWLLTALGMGLAYYVCFQRGDPVAALAAPMLMSAYYVYPESNSWMMTSELQGAVVTLLSICAYILVGWPLGVAMLAASILIREWAAIPLGLALALALWRRDRRQVLFTAVLLGLVALLYAYHSHLYRTALGATHTVPVGHRLAGSLVFALGTLRFGAVYLAGRDLVMPVLGLLGLASIYLHRRDATVWLPAATGGCLFALFHVVGFEPGSYYGFAYVPLVLWAVGLSLARMAGKPT